MLLKYFIRLNGFWIYQGLRMLKILLGIVVLSNNRII